MELERDQMIMIGVGAFIVLFAIWWFYFKKTTGGGESSSADTKAAASSSDRPTIYGSLGCPYTVKQMEKYKDHEFVDCSAGGCPSFVTAYPTTKWPNGKIEVGFS